MCIICLPFLHSCSLLGQMKNMHILSYNIFNAPFWYFLLFCLVIVELKPLFLTLFLDAFINLGKITQIVTELSLLRHFLHSHLENITSLYDILSKYR